MGCSDWVYTAMKIKLQKSALYAYSLLFRNGRCKRFAEAAGLFLLRTR